MLALSAALTLAAQGLAAAPAAPSALAALNSQCAEKISAANYKLAQSLCKSANEQAAAHAAGSIEQVRALRNLAALNRDLGHFEIALPLLEQALKIAEQNSDNAKADPHELITTLSDLALLYQIDGRQNAAEAPLLRALALADKSSGASSRTDLEIRYRLGLLYYDQHRYADAEPLFTSAVATAEKILGSNDATTVALRESLARVEKELAASAAPGLSNSIGSGPNP